jgi:DNA-directed RNA polymerase
MLSARNQAKIPPMPKKGKLILEQVLESDYFFA